MNTNPNVSAICATVLLLAVLGGVFVLAWHGTLTGGQVVGVVMAIVGIAAAAFAVHKTAVAIKRAQSQPPA